MLWLLSLAACAGVAVLLDRISAQTGAAQLSRGEAVVARACDLVRDRYGFYVTNWRGPVPALSDPALRADLATVVSVALAGQDGIAGGLWQAEAGALTSTDRAGDALPLLRPLNERVAGEEQAASRRVDTGGQLTLLQACPLPGPIPELTAWTALQVRSVGAAEQLSAGLGLLLALVAGMSGWLAWTLVAWSRQVAGVARALGRHPAPLGPTGEPGLDRIVDALNASGRRLAEERRHSDALGLQVAQARRLAALGRVAAGVAHEIRNPIASMRLRAENALATDDPVRRQRALHAVLDGVARLDRLSGELLAMTQHRQPVPAPVDLRALLQACADDHAEAAGAVSLSVEAEGEAVLDAALIRRALDNLVGNALRHTPAGGSVRLLGGPDGAGICLAVEDTGPGVAPELLGSLFEPFVTGRPDGTGLGLAIAREMVEAHGGTLRLEPVAAGSRFAIHLPGRG